MISRYFLEPFILISLIEFISIFLCIIVILILHFALNKKKDFQFKAQEIISRNLLIALEEELDFDPYLLSHKYKIEDLLKVVEDFDLKFSSNTWDSLKINIIKKYLIEKARKFTFHKSWLKRNFAARCFSLYSEVEDIKNIYILLKDSIPLISITAAMPAAKLDDPLLYNALFEVMIPEPKKSRYGYRDAILNGNKKIFPWIEEQLKVEKDSRYRFAYFDILFSIFNNNLTQFVQEDDLASTDDNLKLISLKILTSFPNPNYKNKIISFIKDPNYLIRAEICKSLFSLLKDEAIPYLNDMLNDDIWWVRLQAALSLKKIPTEGKNVLLKQNQATSPQAYEIASYVLALPETNP